MLSRLSSLLALAIAVVLLGAPVFAQKPTPGDWFEETQDIGFKIRTPKDWRFVPPDMKDEYTIAKYVPEGNDSVSLYDFWTMSLLHWIVRFDMTDEQAKFDAMVAEMLDDLDVESYDDLPEEMRESLDEQREEFDLDKALVRWCDRNEPTGRGYELIDEGKLKISKGVYARELCFEGRASVASTSSQDADVRVRVYMALIEVRPNVHVGLIFNALADKSKYKKSEKYFTKIVKTFEQIERIEPEVFDTSGPSNAREDKRRELQASIDTMPGWWMTQTDNYFILTDSKDEKFIDEVGVRLEAIRTVYETDYPASKARRVATPVSGLASTGPDDEGEPALPGEAGPGDDGEAKPKHGDSDTVVAKDSLDQSRLSVVRICSDQDMYSSYGGPGGSAGYWSSYHEELVLYDDRKRGGRRNTWAVLNHEAFHQYIYYFYGSLAPHSWYNEGTGDFYSGYEYNSARKNFKLKEFDWRRDLAKKLIREDSYVPLSELVYWSQRQYYGSNEYGAGGGENYAQGWSFIFFLRNGKGEPKKWNDDWNGILETYLDELAATGDLDASVDTAFEGVDWKELEECWKNYMG